MFNNDNPIGYKKLVFKYENNIIVPETQISSSTDENGSLVSLHYDKHDNNGNILQYHKENDIDNSFIWGYHNQLVVASIANSEYAEVEQFVADIKIYSNLDTGNCFDSGTCEEKELRNRLNALRSSLPNSHISTYTYDPGIGLTSITDQSGKTEYYRYNEFNKLELSYNHNENILKKHEYNYIDGYYPEVVETEIYSILELGAPIKFYNPGIIGSNEDNTFTWELKKGTVLLETFTSTNGVFESNLEVDGTLTIFCKIDDNITGISKSTITSFFVSKTNLDFEFSSIITISGNEGHAEQFGTIICPAYDEITFTLRNRTGDPHTIVTAIIGDNGTLLLQPYEDVDVIYNVIKGQELDCSINIDLGLTGDDAEIEITGLKYHIGNIGDSNMLHVDID